MNRVMVVIGVALLAAGVAVGCFLHVHSGGYDCGVPFGGAAADLDVSLAEIQDQIRGGTGISGCSEARASAQVLPIVLLIVGAVVLAGSAFVARSTRSESAVV